MATGGRKPVACLKMLIFSHLVNFGRNFPPSLLRWQIGLGTAWPVREPEVKRPESNENFDSAIATSCHTFEIRPSHNLRYLDGAGVGDKEKNFFLCPLPLATPKMAKWV